MNEYSVTVILTEGAVKAIAAAGIPFERVNWVTSFERPSEALRAAAVLAEEPNWYPEVRKLAKAAAMAVPTKPYLDAYPPSKFKASS